MNTVEKILQAFEDKAKQHGTVNPSYWLDGAMKLTSLLGNETDKLYLKQKELAQMKLDFLNQVDENGKKFSVAMANLKVEATDEWVEMKQLEAKIKRAEEIVRLAKKKSTSANNELRGY